MKFRYALNGHGWAKGFIEINEKKCNFLCSYTTKGISELLERLLQMMTQVPISEMNPNPMYWDEEPNETAWTFEKTGDDELLICIDYIESVFENEEWDTKQKTLLRETVKLSGFVGAVLEQAKQLLEDHGIVGYRYSWGEEFPLAHFLQLEQILLNSPISVAEHEETYLYRSDFNQEINSLAKCLK